MQVKIGPYPKKIGERKINVKIDKDDIYSMDVTLAHIIHPMLVKLKESNRGSPNVSDEHVPDALKSTASKEPKKHEWDVDSNLHERWSWVLDEMIWTFEQIKNDNGNTFFSDDYKEFEARIDRGTNLFGIYFRSLWT